MKLKVNQLKIDLIKTYTTYLQMTSPTASSTHMRSLRPQSSLENDSIAPPSNFSIYNLITPPLKYPTNTHTDWILNIDRSGSMDALTGDGRSRMDHVKHMVKNFIDYLKTVPNTTATISLLKFDHECDVLVECLEINAEQNYDTFIEELEPRGMTDMGKALTMAKCIRDKVTNPVHILLTDGHITQGDTNPTKLIKYLSTTDDDLEKNVFIGFGADHNNNLLEALADNANRGIYYFVESFENAGLAYGEVIHDHLYEYAQDVTITVQNGEIYNYKTNTWGPTINIPSLAGGCTKTYHIRQNDASSDNLDITTTIYCLEPDQGTPPSSSSELQKYWFRQQTQEFLYETKQHITDAERSAPTSSVDYLTRNDQKLLNERLTTFKETMKNYMTANNLINDLFMKNLCDDIHTAVLSLSAKNRRGGMYVGARQTSQGTQRAYNTTNLTDLQDSDAYDGHTMSQDKSIYSTSKCASIMRSVSGVHSLLPCQAPTSTTWTPPPPQLHRSSANIPLSVSK